MINLWLITGAVLAAAAAAAALRRRRPPETSLAPQPTAVPPVSEEWLSSARGREELQS